VKGLSERTEKECRTLENSKLKLAFRSIRRIRQTLVRVKSKTPSEKKKGVVYEIHCGGCEQVHTGETGRTLKIRISAHKQPVKRGDMNNERHRGTRKKQGSYYQLGGSEHQDYRDGLLEEEGTGNHHNPEQINPMTLDCGLSLSKLWLPALELC
jgi:hypothetical protein